MRIDGTGCGYPFGHGANLHTLMSKPDPDCPRGHQCTA
ncbi:hypothetical protein ALSL_0143 [Aerosticca soli]|uniref:Uncharacterized protein n=1 Tax=Aerosticca soli TaxID=2010829 RepID=A0A2Z6E1Q7_9GAMM|nr:hypothetical protein ALSL_0143 [Aerosticca soli]